MKLVIQKLLKTLTSEIKLIIDLLTLKPGVWYYGTNQSVFVIKIFGNTSIRCYDRWNVTVEELETRLTYLETSVSDDYRSDSTLRKLQN